MQADAIVLDHAAAFSFEKEFSPIVFSMQSLIIAPTSSFEKRCWNTKFGSENASKVYLRDGVPSSTHTPIQLILC